jgi:chromosome partitioning protein
VKTILVTNRKGGVGKTTTSLNVAVNLALKGYKVLLIDIDTQGHIQVGLGEDKEYSLGIHDMLKLNKFYKKSIHKTSIKTLDFIPAHVNFDISEFANESVKLKKIFKKIKEKKSYDFCIIDTPPTSDTLLKNALIVSDYALIPMQCEYLSLKGVLQFMRIFYKHTTSLNSKIKLIGVVPTMYNKSMLEHQDILKKLKLEIGDKKVLNPIRKDIKLANAFISGVPLLTCDPRARGTVDYKNLTEEILFKIK